MTGPARALRSITIASLGGMKHVGNSRGVKVKGKEGDIAGLSHFYGWGERCSSAPPRGVFPETVEHEPCRVESHNQRNRMKFQVMADATHVSQRRGREALTKPPHYCRAAASCGPSPRLECATGTGELGREG